MPKPPKLPLQFLIKRSVLMEITGLGMRECLHLEAQRKLTRNQLHRRQPGAHRGGTVRYRRDQIVRLYPDLD